MIDIDKEAIQQLKEFRNRKGADSSVRIGILSGSSRGPMLGVSVDEKNDNDEVFSFGDLEIIIDGALLKYCEEIQVEYVQQDGGGCSGGGGFKIIPKNQI